MSVVLFDVRSGIAGARHKFMGLKRVVLSQSPVLYADKLINHPPAGLSSTASLSKETCHICGFRMIILTAMNSWTIELCPVDWKSYVTNEEHLSKWLEDFAQLSSYNRVEDKTPV
jgi:hypothetical protein